MLAAYMIEKIERTLVAGKDDMGILEEMRTEEIAKRMVFLVKREDCAVWGTCTSQQDADRVLRSGIRVSGTSEHFFSSAPSKNNSNLPRKSMLSSRLKAGKILTYLERSSRCRHVELGPLHGQSHNKNGWVLC